MRFEQQAFARKKVKPETLEAFGFQKREDGWVYSEIFLGGEFRADVQVLPDGQVRGRVWDLAADEEYLPVHVQTRYGPFVGAVREGYGEILQRIGEACFEQEAFLYPQTNRLAEQIRRIYGEDFDHPFEKSPDSAVFRYPPNRKWYGLVMAVPKSALTGEKTEGEEAPVEILNVKVRPEKLEPLLALPGIYPSYHMKHTSWVSVMLDGTVPDEQVMALIDESRAFAVSAGKKARPTGPVSWIVPANPRYYDVEAAFRDSREIIWKQGRGIAVGDTVYLYVAAPVSAVRYRCRVTETGIPFSFQDKNVSMTQVMRILLQRTYPPESFPLEKLKNCGVKTVRGPIWATEAFMEQVRQYEADCPQSQEQ